MGSKGEVLQNGLNGEKHEEGVAAALPPRKTVPFKRAVGRANLKKPTPSASETAQPSKPPGAEHQSKGDSPPGAAQRPGKGLQRCPEGLGKEGEAPGRKGLETARKEKQPPRTKAGVKKEPGGVKKEMEEVKKGAGESKKEAGVRKGPGERGEEAGGGEERELSKKDAEEVAQEPGESRPAGQEDPKKVEAEVEETEEPGASLDSDTVKVRLCPCVLLSGCPVPHHEPGPGAPLLHAPPQQSRSRVPALLQVQGGDCSAAGAGAVGAPGRRLLCHPVASPRPREAESSPGQPGQGSGVFHTFAFSSLFSFLGIFLPPQQQGGARGFAVGQDLALHGRCSPDLLARRMASRGVCSPMQTWGVCLPQSLAQLPAPLRCMQACSGGRPLSLSPKGLHL